MFTGLVEQIGSVTAITAEQTAMKQITVKPSVPPFDVSLGDSVAVNGCCLTVAAIEGNKLMFEVSQETWEKTAFAALKIGDPVNLERALRFSDRLGGHLVTGHVDAVCEVGNVKKGKDGWVVSFLIPTPFARYFVQKGSVCLNGVSLTVNDVVDKTHHTEIFVTLIPTTVNVTNLQVLTVGQKINFEVDLVAKYLERFSLYGRS